MMRTTRGPGAIEKSSRLRPGVKRTVAYRLAVAALAGGALAGSALAEGAAAGSTSATAVAMVPAARTMSFANTYTTKAGDTLYKVARRFGITWQQLAKLNQKVLGERPGPWRRLRVGTVLNITTPLPPPPPTLPSAGTFTAYVTGYTWFDNTPAGSADISHPVLHQKADGTGTYADPITVAVGHDMSSGRDVLDYAAGTRFYMPYLQRYFIVEDTCGDGARPENGACHKHPSNVTAWLDIWVDGEGGSSSSADACARRITGNHVVEMNPPNGRAVTSGSVASGGRCAI